MFSVQKINELKHKNVHRVLTKQCPDGFEKFKTKSSDPEKLRCIAHTRDITIESVQDAARVCQGMNPNATLPLPETAESAFELLDALSDYSPNQKRLNFIFSK